MKKSVLKIVVILLVFGFQVKSSSAQTYPVTTNINVVPPYTIFLNDYYSSSSEKLKINIVFNDFNESQWDVKLHLKIESNNVLIENKQEFRPTQPITIFPGESKLITGADLTQNFHFDNLIIEGLNLQEFTLSKKLKEGLYTFSVEVLDYNTGRKLSNTSSTIVDIKLGEIPVAITPIKEEVLTPSESQAINFSWQCFNVDPLTTFYHLHLFEIQDYNVEPNIAVENNQALKIFESEYIYNTSYFYGADKPLLEKGKIYAFYIQAFDSEGRSIFKNNGIGEVSWFYYGYPENGVIELISPLNNAALPVRSQKVFEWGPPNNLTPGQIVQYELKITKLNDRDPSASILDEPWFLYQSIPRVNTTGYNKSVPKDFDANTEFVWQLKAYTGSQEIAKSEVRVIKGPPPIEFFYAGNHKITVLSTENEDLTNLTGIGKFRFYPNGDYLQIDFEDINLELRSINYFIKNSEIVSEFPTAQPIEITAEADENGSALFYPQKIRLNSEELAVGGYIEWEFPIPAMSETLPKIKTKFSWFNYDELKLLGFAQLDQEYNIKLVDPLNFEIHLDDTTGFMVGRNNYLLTGTGYILFPENVKTKNGNRFSMSFRDIRKIHYFSIKKNNDNTILPFENLHIEIQPEFAIADFADFKSYVNSDNSENWKGINITSSDLLFKEDIDENQQLVFEEFSLNKITYSNSSIVEIVSQGINLNLNLNEIQNEAIKFNTFPGRITNCNFSIDKNVVQSSSIKGKIKIPVISESTDYEFIVPIVQNGFLDGYLSQSLEGMSLEYNSEGGEQKLDITIKRAVFKNYNHLEMGIDISWPSVDLTFHNVNGFCAWGNYDIGFSIPNGITSLDQQITGKVGDFEVTCDYIGCGRQANVYGIGTSASIVMTEDVSGDNGPPKVNLYSLYENSLLPEPEDGEFDSSVDESNDTGGEGEFDFGAALAEIDNEISTLENIQSQIADLLMNNDDIVNEANSAIEEITGSATNITVNIDDVTNNNQQIVAEDSVFMNFAFGISYDRIEEYKNEIISEIVFALTNPINEKVNDVTGTIHQKVIAVVDSINTNVEISVERTVDGILDDIIASIENEELQAEAQITANSIKSNITQTIKTRLSTYAEMEFIQPVNNIIRQKVNNTVEIILEETLYEVVENGINVNINLTQLFADVSNEILNNEFNGDKLKSAIVGKFNVLFREVLNPESILNEILQGIQHDLENQLASKLEERGEVFADSLLAGIGLGTNVDLDFSNVGEKLKNGDIAGLIKLDPCYIEVNTRVASFAGEIDFTRDDPVYGDVWSGNLDFVIKVPTQFSFSGSYLNGKKDDYGYWFIQISPDQEDSFGSDMSNKKAKPLTNPVNLGVANLVGFSGRLYHHMKDEITQIVPDANTNYGAYLNVVFFDRNKGGQILRLDVAAGLTTQTNGDYVIEFDGNMQSLSYNPQVTVIDENAGIQGGLAFNYNSAEKHFVGSGYAIIQKPALCAEGYIAVDIKPGEWMVGIGSREQRIIFVPACTGFSPTGWLVVDQSVIDLGLGLQLSAYAETGKISLGVYEVVGYADVGAALGIMSKIQYNPSLKLLEAGVWAEAWAEVGANYTSEVFGSGNLTLISAYLNGYMLVIFDPPPTTAIGELDVQVSVLCFDANFNLEFEKQLN